MNMIKVTIERNPAAIATFKRIIRELKHSNKDFNNQHPIYQYIYKQMRIHQTTQQIGMKGPNEMHHLADTYATYLESGRRLSELHEKYCKGERTIEQAARMVGLELPKTQTDEEEANNKRRNDNVGQNVQ